MITKIYLSQKNRVNRWDHVSLVTNSLLSKQCIKNNKQKSQCTSKVIGLKGVWHNTEVLNKASHYIKVYNWCFHPFESSIDDWKAKIIDEPGEATKEVLVKLYFGSDSCEDKQNNFSLRVWLVERPINPLVELMKLITHTVYSQQKSARW